MRLALTAGGTGGHILPALAVLEAVRARASSPVEVRFFGPEDRGERRTVEQAGLRFERVPAAQIRGRNPLQLVRSAW
ncbi:MAG: glycosyltransferase, partial [Tepidiformaceae bacterium]